MEKNEDLGDFSGSSADVGGGAEQQDKSNEVVEDNYGCEHYKRKSKFVVRQHAI